MSEFLRKLSPVLYGALVIGAFGLGMLVMYLIPHHDGGMRELRDEGKYKYVSPLLACGEPSGTLPKEVQDMREGVEAIISEHTRTGGVTEAAVYFRDLSNGPWFGVHEELTFVPGSLLKVPMLMAYYKRLETDPTLAEQKLLFDAPIGYAYQNIAVANPMTPGQEYSANDLLNRMVKESDNDAATLLYKLIGGMETNRVYTELGLPAPLAGRDYEVSVQFYATFFRILYNATYLSADMSERALDLLTQVEYKDGLVAGVPSTVLVAHKFGERKYDDNTATQLHDCGIVYAPGRPYTLCVMTRGHDLERQSKVIEEISRKVYADFAN